MFSCKADFYKLGLIHFGQWFPVRPLPSGFTSSSCMQPVIMTSIDMKNA